MLARMQVWKVPVEEPEQSWDRQVLGESGPGRAGWIAIPWWRTRSASSAPAVVAGGASRVTTTVAATSMAASSSSSTVCVNLDAAECREQTNRQDDRVARAPNYGEHPCPFHEDRWFRRKTAGLCTTGMTDWFVPIAKLDRVSTRSDGNRVPVQPDRAYLTAAAATARA
jgi:hypothetical protein